MKNTFTRVKILGTDEKKRKNPMVYLEMCDGYIALL